jgi:hypothetical protein
MIQVGSTGPIGVQSKIAPIGCGIVYGIVAIVCVAWLLWLPIRMKHAPADMRTRDAVQWAVEKGWTPPSDHDTRHSKYECAKTCQCTNAGLKQYGRYCGFGYTGCLRQEPCDAVDMCCMLHDECVEIYGYTNCECHRNMTACISCAFKSDPSLSWCPKMIDAAANIAADFVYLLPKCFE